MYETPVGVFVKIHRTCTPTVDLIVNCGLWKMMVCPCRFISCHKWTTQVWDGDSGYMLTSRGREYRGTLHFLLNFAVKKLTPLGGKKKKGKWAQKFSQLCLHLALVSGASWPLTFADLPLSAR